MRRALLLGLALLVLVCVAYTVYWNVMASRSGEWVAYWAAPAPGKAWSATYAATEASGFPFSLDIAISEPAVTWQGSTGVAIWQGPSLLARFKPWTLASFSFDLPRDQIVTVDNGLALRRLVVTLDEGTAEVAMDDGRARALEAVLTGMVVAETEGFGTMSAERIEIDVAALSDQRAQNVAIAARGLVLPQTAAPPFFPPEVPSAHLAFIWKGDLPDGGLLAARLNAWREAGGVVDVTELEVDWPPLDVSAEGTLALDRELRPIGAFRADVVGYRALLDAMEAVGSLERGQATVAGTALDFMAATGDDGVKQLAVDVSIQNGMLSVGPIRVMEVPPVIPPSAGF